MGWQGVKEAFVDWEQDKKEEERFNRGLIEQRKNTLIPYLTKAHAANTKSQAASRSVLSFFNNRLDGTSEAEKNAFMNIIRDNPEMGASIYSSVIRNEEKYPGITLSGTKLLQFSNIIDQTKPDNMSIEEWTEEAANRVYKSNAKTVTDMLESVLSADDIETMPTLVDVMEATAPEPGIPGGLVDFRGPVGMRPEEEKQYVAQVYTRLEAELNNKIATLVTKVNEASADGLSTADLEAERTRLATLKKQAADNPYNLMFEFPDLTQSLITSIAANDAYIENSNLYRTFMVDVSNM
tara:strand:+ start:315 stop:1199 length:885 start_codon:yes stop_codon:yes gene_type:complete